MTKDKLKALIAKGESNGDYDVLVGGARKPLREMTIAEVLKLQEMMVEKGFKSSAVGKYQLIESTMRSLLYKQDGKTPRNPKDFNPNQKFDERAQEWAADTLLDRRGFQKWAEGEQSDDEFLHSLSKEWASLPDPKRKGDTTSHYGGDGMHDRPTPHTVEEMRDALQSNEPVPELPTEPQPPAGAPQRQQFTDSPTVPTPPPAKQPQMNGLLDTGMPASPQQAAPLGQQPGAGMLMTPRGDVINPIDPDPMPQRFSF